MKRSRVWLLALVVGVTAGCTGINTSRDDEHHDNQDSGDVSNEYDRNEDSGAKTSTSGELKLTPYLLGDTIYIAVEKGPIRYLTCSGAVKLEKQVGSQWKAPQDDRYPSASNPGFYLDGRFIEPSQNMGCDQRSCEIHDDKIFVARALEYVETGTQAAPTDAPTATGTVPVVESRPLSGTVRIALVYSYDEACDGTKTTEVTFDIPADGVCCPIAEAGCSNENPPTGGWAPTLDACPDWNVQFEAYYDRRTDPWGCPVLVRDNTVCCGCE
jgi:hypothetical protein